MSGHEALAGHGPNQPGRPPTGAPRAKKRGRPAGGEKVRLRIGNLANAVLVTGQAYQDPKDALNEFVSNAADEYALADRRGERIRVVLRRKGRNPVIAVDDLGRGMQPDRLREVARNLFESAKAGDDRTLGEKAIGLLGFQQLGRRCEIVSRCEGSAETWTLSLDRGRANAMLTRERRRARTDPGTTVYLSQLDPEVLRMLTQRKVVEYLRRRRGPALARGDYAIEVVEGRSSELVTPVEPDGVRLDIRPQPTLWGRIEFALYVTSDIDVRRQVAVVGRAGTTILDHLSELEEFDHPPWTAGQVTGQIMFEALQQTAGRRAVLRDRDTFPVFRDAVVAVETAVARTIEQIQEEVDNQSADRMADAVRRIFGRVLRELADLENPMRTAIGSDAGAGGLLANATEGGESGEPSTPDSAAIAPDRSDEQPAPGIDDLAPDPIGEQPPRGRAGDESARPQDGRSRHLPTVVPDPEPGLSRSRFDPDAGIVFYNDRHADYLLVKQEEPALLDYLATLVAKEYVVYNNPRAGAEEVSEDLVRMLVRIRRHMPRRR